MQNAPSQDIVDSDVDIDLMYSISDGVNRKCFNVLILLI
jgi:hypothetical protein